MDNADFASFMRGLDRPDLVRSLTLENFKGFGTRQCLPLAPLTLIYGPNSGGKTSILQALAMLSQSASSSASGLLDPHGPLVDLGGLRALLHRHDASKVLTLGFACEAGEVAYEFDAQLGTSRDSCSLRSLSMRDSNDCGFTIRNTGRPSDYDEHGTAFQMSDIEACDAWRRLLAQEATADANKPARSPYVPDAGELIELARLLNSQQVLSSFHSDALACAEFVVHDLFSVRAYCSGLLSSEADGVGKAFYPLDDYVYSEEPTGRGLEKLRRAIQDLAYLGPLRMPAGRLFTPSSRAPSVRGLSGELAPLMLHKGGDMLRASVNEWLRRLEISYEVSVDSHSDDVMGTLLALRLRSTSPGAPSSTRLSFDDVGFGVGQVFPILIEGLASEARVICVEQPEIHLHPRLQANLADFFIETSAAHSGPEASPSKPATKPRQWILETHSEAMILRIQRRIRDGSLDPKDVSVLYVQNDGGDSSTAQRLRLDEEGRFLDEWPDGFFDESLREMLA